MAPPPVVVARNGFGILDDPAYTVAADSHHVEDVELAGSYHSSPLRTISSSNTHNRRPKLVSRVESLTAQLEKLHIGDSHQVTPCKGKAVAKTKAQPGARVTRPSVTANTFAPLESVAEDEQAHAPERDPAAVSRERPRYIELPVDRYAQHPLAVAARTSPSAAEQFTKQRNGDFDWVLTVKPPAASESSEGKKLFFGCNLLPVPASSEIDAPSKEGPRSYTLLATPLEGNEEPVINAPPAKETTMALAEAPKEKLAPAKTGTEPLPAIRVEELAPSVVHLRDGNGSSVPAGVPGVPSKKVEGIEAIDQFEDEMEAFELAAGIKTTVSPSVGVADIRLPRMPAPALGPVPHRDRTPAPQLDRPTHGANSSKSRSGRRPSSMILLDSPKLKGEDKAWPQASPKKTPSKVLASLQSPKPLTRSTKAPKVAAFELPGEAVARRLREQREARRASQGAQPQSVQDGGDKVACRLGRKQEARLSTQFTQAKPHRPKAVRTAITTTDVTSDEQEEDSDDWSIPDEITETIMAHHNARLTPIRCALKPMTQDDSDGECISADMMEVIMAHHHAHLTPIRCAPKSTTENYGDNKSIHAEFMGTIDAHHQSSLGPVQRVRPEPPKPTSSLRGRTSTKEPTLPHFELPGEAISLRKREEQEAKRKAQEEEERKRRQFKARPIRIAAAPSTMPRETIASRARLTGALFEKPARPARPAQDKRGSVVMDTQPRGRHLTTATSDQAGPRASRATSSSVGSTGKRSSVSLEEVQQQRVRGKDIFQRDSALSQDRTKERRERETRARIAREEAAERSRQKSREWAEKQKRKSLRLVP